MRWIASFFLSFLLASAAYGNAADCYWFIADGDLQIRVTYESGHEAVVGEGDYLPVGCNVVSYTVYGSTGAPGFNGCLLFAPDCETGVEDFWLAYVNNLPDGAPVGFEPGDGPIGTNPPQSPVCNGCGDCVDENPNDPDGDDDGDGVRNECDPDHTACDDVDGDGCCDSCGNDCGPEECDQQVGSGRCNECDAENVPCVDEDEDGCCDWCSSEECDEESSGCEEGGSGWPDCCSSYTDAPDCQGLECNSETPGFPECCDEHSQAPECIEPECECIEGVDTCCVDNPEHENYPECACEDSCMNCDPCTKFDLLIGAVNGLRLQMSGMPTGDNPSIDVGSWPEASPPALLEEGPSLLGTGVEGGPLNREILIPIPGRSPLLINLSVSPSAWGLSGAWVSAGGAVESIRVIVRTILSLLIVWAFFGRVLRLLFSM